MPRLIFANQLRGVAALCVVCSHLVGVFWGMRDFVGLATASPPQEGAAPGLFALVNQTWFNFGPFGVALFFLISGLVIPVSLAQHNRGSFLLARALRIYPTLLAALLLDIAVLHADAYVWNRPFPYSDLTILSNALLVYNMVGLPSIDLVNWTLCIEVKFYLLMALLYGPICRWRTGALFVTAAMLVEVSSFAGQASVGTIFSSYGGTLTAVSTEAPFLIFMLCGVLFNFNLSGHLVGAKFGVALAVMTALFLIAWRLSPLQSQFFVVTANYCYGLVIFLTLYLLRGYAVQLRALDGLARISFPLYLIHSIIGFSVLKMAMLTFHLSYLAALAWTVMVVISVAAALHVTVERWTIALGRRVRPAALQKQRVVVI